MVTPFPPSHTPIYLLSVIVFTLSLSTSLTLTSRIYPDDNGLHGYLPSELTSLPKLQQIYLSSNSIGGTIPTRIGHLQHVRSLDQSQNSLRGSIPRQIGFCTNLRLLHLADNDLSGSLPKELFWQGSQLTILNVSRNKRLGGVLPSSSLSTSSSSSIIAPLTTTANNNNNDQLLELHLSGCDFSGSIPSDIGGRRLDSLVKLDRELKIIYSSSYIYIKVFLAINPHNNKMFPFVFVFV